MTVEPYVAIKVIEDDFKRTSRPIHTERWQGMEIKGRPDAKMMEATFCSLFFNMPNEDLDYYRHQIKPNLPWADEHFEKERVSGEPINPGETWKIWPWAKWAAGHVQEQFNHSYAERYWPKYAGMTEGGKINQSPEASMSIMDCDPHRGIRHDYGDLAGVVRHLVKEPLTRQAYLPVWFPEDTGDAHDGRKPCTLGYHFMMREGKLNVAYYIRSCDIVRHFRDDIYLTVRLLLWVLAECRKQDRLWYRVVPGDFHMHISSLHCFINDWHQMVKSE